MHLSDVYEEFLQSRLGLNPTLWYMPVIIGLYVIFPILIKILEKYGPWIFFMISAMAIYGGLRDIRGKLK